MSTATHTGEVTGREYTGSSSNLHTNICQDIQDCS